MTVQPDVVRDICACDEGPITENTLHGSTLVHSIVWYLGTQSIGSSRRQCTVNCALREAVPDLHSMLIDFLGCSRLVLSIPTVTLDT